MRRGEEEGFLAHHPKARSGTGRLESFIYSDPIAVRRLHIPLSASISGAVVSGARVLELDRDWE